MMQHHCQTSIDWIYFQISDDEDKTMMVRPSWHTSLTALPLCPKIPGNRSGSGQRRQIERVRRLFCTCSFDLWGFELSMYQLVSFFSGTMHVKLSCCLVVWQTFWKLFINTEGAPIRPLTCDDHSIHPSIHPSHPLFALHRPERHKMKNQDNLQRTKMNGDELKSHLVHTNCQ